MTGPQRREQLLDVGRRLFAEKGFEGTSVEEIAARAEVSKPVVYEHFGGKEGLYAVVVDREIRLLLGEITGALTSGGSARVLVEQAALGLLGYQGVPVLSGDGVDVSFGCFAADAERILLFLCGGGSLVCLRPDALIGRAHEYDLL